MTKRKKRLNIQRRRSNKTQPSSQQDISKTIHQDNLITLQLCRAVLSDGVTIGDCLNLLNAYNSDVKIANRDLTDPDVRQLNDMVQDALKKPVDEYKISAVAQIYAAGIAESIKG